MRFVAYPSKIYNFVILICITSLAIAIWNFFPVNSGIPLWVTFIFGFLFFIIIAVTIANLASTRPGILIDENGISCYQQFYSPIPWSAVVSANRVPRVQKIKNGKKVSYHFCLSDASRPIDLTISNLEKYSKIVPSSLHNRLCHTIKTDSGDPVCTLRLEFGGLNGSSEAAIEIIEHYLSQKKG